MLETFSWEVIYYRQSPNPSQIIRNVGNSEIVLDINTLGMLKECQQLPDKVAAQRPPKKSSSQQTFKSMSSEWKV